jgi:hypothetical protein
VIAVPHDVIVSYATIDKPTADAVCARLEERAIRCWIALRDILAGMDYAEKIISAIDSAKMLIFSSHANTSKHVIREAERAVYDSYRSFRSESGTSNQTPRSTPQLSTALLARGVLCSGLRVSHSILVAALLAERLLGVECDLNEEHKRTTTDNDGRMGLCKPSKAW